MMIISGWEANTLVIMQACACGLHQVLQGLDLDICYVCETEVHYQQHIDQKGIIVMQNTLKAC